ncbi:MAG TPA: hypothetical protein VIF40_20440 [Methylosinus sp.]|jgi:hypothetical protein|uniref:hypothetical protein n=1 Tax=Methylosinus sp. TaxID=427 RepID=UPI002F952373
MTPGRARAALDRALALTGEPCRLERLLPSGVIHAVDVLAAVRDYTAVEVGQSNGGLQAGFSKVIMSSSEIDAAGWPDLVTRATQTADDPRIPRRGDRLVHQGRVRIVQSAWAAPRVEGELVRIELSIK